MTIQPTTITKHYMPLVLAVSMSAFASACHRGTPTKADTAAIAAATGAVYTVRDTAITATFDAAGVAAPIQQATLSTKLTGSITEVLVKEGDVVSVGQPLVRIDARDLDAKSAQVSASVSEAEAVHRDAMKQANRIRSLYADSAATRAQLDAAETGLARAEAGLRTAHAVASELGVTASYAVVRAPFSGAVAKRFVDPGAFAVPGAPLVTVQDVASLRITASATPDVARTLRRGQTINGTIEGRPVASIIEGVVPAPSGHLYTINAIVPNSDRAALPGSAATLALAAGERTALVVPPAAIVREGDLTGVLLRSGQGDERRWVRLGSFVGASIEVTAGLRAGDQIVIPTRRIAASDVAAPSGRR